MTICRRVALAALGGLLVSSVFGDARTQTDFSAYTDAEKETLLLKGTIVSTEVFPRGVTKPVVAELRLNDVTHKAKVQTIDKVLPDFFGEDGTVLPMRDSWRYNVAAYKLDRLLKLNMVAVEVARPFKGVRGSFSWWVDDVKGEDAQRMKENWTPPDAENFERQRALIKVFDELIINIDRNYGNILITNSWRLALIDHTRSFVAYPKIRNKDNLTRCSRDLMANMAALTTKTVTEQVGNLLTPQEVAALLARRDRIVAFFKEEAAKKGEGRVFFQ
jgi:hypothetical protein